MKPEGRREGEEDLHSNPWIHHPTHHFYSFLSPFHCALRPGTQRSKPQPTTLSTWLTRNATKRLVTPSNLSTKRLSRSPSCCYKTLNLFEDRTISLSTQGMNFQFMWSVQQNSDVLFWEIAITVMLVVIRCS
ncbi:hypothetical protein FB446DRAFT_493489 [Lentinula raphanica]|nr:hypothetical protein FB446DRAFT_493489 [Lentinula raphanica]